jgi:hypothetical protein
MLARGRRLSMWPKSKGASNTESRPPVDGADLLGWRQVRLLRAGFDSEQASLLAADRAMDLHALIDLVDRGCPPPLAVRILWPLEREGDPC